MAWAYRVKIKHLFTDKDDHASVQASMSAVADVIKNDPAFILFFGVDKFYEIPQGDDVFGPADYANRLLEKLYSYADSYRVWIE